MGLEIRHTATPTSCKDRGFVCLPEPDTQMALGNFPFDMLGDPSYLHNVFFKKCCHCLYVFQLWFNFFNGFFVGFSGFKIWFYCIYFNLLATVFVSLVRTERCDKNSVK